MSEPFSRKESNGNGNTFRAWLPLYFFLAAQAGAGIWWMATISADVRSIIREQSRQDARQEVLSLQFQKLDKEFAVFVAQGGRIMVQQREN
jgi:hypothetical protein